MFSLHCRALSGTHRDHMLIAPARLLRGSAGDGMGPASTRRCLGPSARFGDRLRHRYRSGTQQARPAPGSIETAEFQRSSRPESHDQLLVGCSPLGGRPLCVSWVSWTPMDVGRGQAAQAALEAASCSRSAGRHQLELLDQRLAVRPADPVRPRGDQGGCFFHQRWAQIARRGERDAAVAGT
jgi:hypothetical protein